MTNLTNLSSILNRRHWVFDLDGTLTVAVHDFDLIREELGLERGQPIVKTLESLPAVKSEPLRKRLQEIEIKLARKAHPAEGMKSLLNTLEKKKCRLGIVTLNTRENAWTTLKSLGIVDFFEDSFVMGRFCSEPKPSPAGLQWMMKEWGAGPRDTLVVGDYLYDLQMGRAAGTATVHVDQEALFPWPELTDIQCTSLDELHQQLERFSLDS